MGKNKQQELDGEFTDDDMRECKPDSLERDKQRGWNHEESTYQGRDMSALMFSEAPRNRELIYVKKADHSFVFSPRPKRDLNQRRGLTLPHSMLAKGEKVIGAGECETDENGQIKQADNFSGHYQPKEKNMAETKKNMESKGMAAPGGAFEVKDAAGAVVKNL